MSARKSLLRWGNSFLLQILPGFVYVQVARWIIPIFDRQRRDFSSKVRRCDSGYVLHNKDFTIYFYSPYNVGRYLFTSKGNSIKHQMLKKYLAGYLDIPVGGVVIDVGANVGEFSMAIAERGGFVYACEPDPGPFESLERNLRSVQHARCRKVAFGEHTGWLPFYVSSQHNDSSFIKPNTWERVEEIRVSTIDEFCAQEDIKSVAILKVEAEGYEPEILRGASWALSNIVAQVAVDGGPERNGQTTIDACEEILRSEAFFTTREGTLLYGRKER